MNPVNGLLSYSLGPGKFYKGRSQEKTHPLRPEFFLLLSPLDRARSVLTYRAMCSVAGNLTPWFGFSLLAVFIASWRRSLSVPKPTKQNGGQFGDHSSIWDSWPIAFSGCPRGPRVGLRLRARGTQRLTSQLRLALEPECLENPTATAREIPRDGADSIRDTQAVCGFRCWASKHAPLFHTINTMVAIFLAKVRRAISGLMPLVSKAV